MFGIQSCYVLYYIFNMLLLSFVISRDLYNQYNDGYIDNILRGWFKLFHHRHSLELSIVHEYHSFSSVHGFISEETFIL